MLRKPVANSKPGGTIVEPTLRGTPASAWPWSPNGAATSASSSRPDKVSEDKQNVLRAYGAEVVVCPTVVPPGPSDSYYSVSNRLVEEIEGAWKPDQY